MDRAGRGSRFRSGQVKYRDPVVRPLGLTGGLGVPFYTETVLSGGDKRERRPREGSVLQGAVEVPFRRAAGPATGARRGALAGSHHGHRVRS